MRMSLNSSIETLTGIITQETHPESPCCQQVCDEFEEDWSNDSLSPKSLSMELEEGTKALTQPDLEDVEEVGRQDRDPTMIIKIL